MLKHSVRLLPRGTRWPIGSLRDNSHLVYFHNKRVVKNPLLLCGAWLRSRDATDVNFVFFPLREAHFAPLHVAAANWEMPIAI